MRKCIGLLLLALIIVLPLCALAESYPGQEGVDKVYDAAKEKSEKYAPRVTTLANGVKVQRTPDDVGGYWLRPGSYNSYNTYYLNADNRGCGACHTDLAKLLDNMSFEHLDMTNGYDFDLTVRDCLICHDEGAGYLYTTYDFGTLIHGLHSRDSFMGNCWSCHNATSDGNGTMLWDDAKYDVLQGISFVSDIDGEFSFDQTTLTETEDVFTMSWWSSENTNLMGGATLEGLPLDEGIFNNREISVTGEVDNPFTIKLTDLIAQAPSEKKIVTVDCVMNSNGGPFISTTEITGIPFSWILEKAGVKDTATAVMSVATDGWSRGALISEMKKDETYLVYEQNGERLAWAQGYPVTTYNVHDSAASCIRNVVELRVVDTPENEVKRFKGWEYQDGSGNYVNKPSAGIYHLHEGQIIPANEPWTFEGYADAYDEAIVAIEFSLDRGQTWKSFSTEGTGRDAWVYWRFKYTPAPGCYVLSVRAVTETGLVTFMPDEVMFNAK